MMLLLMQGTSVLSPLVPMALLMAMAAIVRNYSTVGIFEHHSVLFVMTFGIAVSKITSKLLVSELLLRLLYHWQ